MDLTPQVKPQGVQPEVPLPAPGEWIEVVPQVRWLRMPLPFALDHINLWLLEADDGFTVVDCGIDIPAVRAAWEQVLARLTRPVRRILVTHFHPDHLGLADWLSGRTGAPVLMTAGEYLTGWAVWSQAAGHGVADMLSFFAAHGLDGERLAALERRGNAYRRGVPALPARYRRLREGDRLPLTGASWQVQVGHGHAPEHAALYCAEAGVLISGDMLLPRITTNISVFAVTPEADSLQEYLDSLGRWRSIGDRVTVLPSHGRPFQGAAARIAALEGHHQARLAEIRTACMAAPKSAAELLPVLFDRALDAHQTMFAMGEAIAHLNHLEHAGAIGRRQGADGVFRYRTLVQ
jgi:glyoxylase-like metal-dependent hydrolase (beta-lactamase superfamily II)